MPKSHFGKILELPPEILLGYCIWGEVCLGGVKGSIAIAPHSLAGSSAFIAKRVDMVTTSVAKAVSAPPLETVAILT